MRPDDASPRGDANGRLRRWLAPHPSPRPTELTLHPPPFAPTQITWLSPPKGHTKGGTVLTLYGSGFKRSTSAKVRRTPPPGGRRLDWI